MLKSVIFNSRTQENYTGESSIDGLKEVDISVFSVMLEG